jgi:hypothetical protein
MFARIVECQSKAGRSEQVGSKLGNDVLVEATLRVLTNKPKATFQLASRMLVAVRALRIGQRDIAGKLRRIGR